MEGTNGTKLMNRAGTFDSDDTWILMPLYQEVAKGNSHYHIIMEQIKFCNRGLLLIRFQNVLLGGQKIILCLEIVVHKAILI